MISINILKVKAADRIHINSERGCNRIPFCFIGLFLKVGLIHRGLPRLVIPTRLTRAGNLLAVPKASPWENLNIDSGYSAKAEFRNDTLGDIPLLVP